MRTTRSILPEMEGDCVRAPGENLLFSIVGGGGGGWLLFYLGEIAMDYPKLRESLLLALVTALAIALAWGPGVWPEKMSSGQAFVRFLLVIVAGAFALFTLWSIANLVWYQASARLYETQRALAYTERVRILDLARDLTPEQVELVKASGITFEWLLGSDGSMIPHRLTTPGGSVPVDFFQTFMRLSGEDFTVPIRTWSEGSQDREYARWMTNGLISMGWAEPAAGNQSARWTRRGLADQLLKQVEIKDLAGVSS
jgi:hypothetical protein